MLCVTESLLVQITVVPALIVKVSGTNLKFSILIEFPDVIDVVAGTVEVDVEVVLEVVLDVVCELPVVVVDVAEQEVIKNMEIINMEMHRTIFLFFILIDPLFSFI